MKLFLLVLGLLPITCYACSAGLTCSTTLMPIGGFCTDSSNCVGCDNSKPRSECTLSSVCDCCTNYVIKSDLTDCLPFINDIGKGCEESPQCTQGALGELSECVPNPVVGATDKNVCSCASTAVAVPSTPPTCMKSATLVNEACEFEEQCTKNLGDEAKCAKTCVCDETLSVPRTNGTKCLNIVKHLSGVCEQSDQCQKGEPGDFSECANGACRCETEAVNLPGTDKCAPKAGIGEFCSDHIQCIESTDGLGACVKSQCVCTIGVPNVGETTCLHVVNKLKGDCEVDLQCKQGTPGELSTCLPLNGHRVCQCLPDALEILGEDKCFKKAEKVGESCKNHQQCTSKLGGYSECNNNVCICKTGSTGSSDDKKCLLSGVLIGQPCEDNNQCIGTSLCSPSGSCSCEENFVSSQDRKRCLNVVKVIGEPCEEIQQCQRGTPGLYSDCFPKGDGNVCNCTSTAVALPGDNLCRKKGEFVGDICEVSEQCSTSVKNSYCVSKKCTCNPNFLPSEDTKNCVEKALLGDQCDDNGQCAETPNATCQQQILPSLGSICKCNANFTDANEGKVCYKLADVIGGPCSEHKAQCDHLPEAVCLPDEADGSLKCQCDLLSHVEGPGHNICLKQVTELGKGCLDNVQCQNIKDASCQRSGDGSTMTCSCNENFVKSVDTPNKCLEIRHNLQDDCTESIQCQAGFGDNTECRGLVCDCTGGYQAIGRRCFKQVSLGQPCAVKEECHVGHNNLTICTPTKGCECGPDSIMYSNVCFAKLRIGDSCFRDLECRVSIYGDSYCDLSTSKCSCLPGQVGDPDIDLLACKSKADNLVVASYIILILGNIICKFFM